jgi:hypothetical protein
MAAQCRVELAESSHVRESITSMRNASVETTPPLRVAAGKQPITLAAQVASETTETQQHTWHA